MGKENYLDTTGKYRFNPGTERWTQIGRSGFIGKAEIEKLGIRLASPLPPPPTPETPPATPPAATAPDPSPQPTLPAAPDDQLFGTHITVEKAPDVTSPDYTAPPPPAESSLPVDHEATAEMFFDAGTGIAANVFGPEMLPKSDEEKKPVVRSIADYLRSIDFKPLSPLWNMLAMIFAYFATRIHVIVAKLKQWRQGKKASGGAQPAPTNPQDTTKGAAPQAQPQSPRTEAVPQAQFVPAGSTDEPEDD